MMRYYILNAAGQIETVQSMKVWGEWFATLDNRIVEKTEVGGAEVSTIFLGIDHSHGFGAVPILFETMVFGGDNDEWCDRYATKTEAVEGHRRVVEALRAGRDLSAEDDVPPNAGSAS